MSASRVDVDSLINRHRQRLEEHRRYLDGDKAQPYLSPKLDINDKLFYAADSSDNNNGNSPSNVQTKNNNTTNNHNDDNAAMVGRQAGHYTPAAAMSGSSRSGTPHRVGGHKNSNNNGQQVAPLLRAGSSPSSVATPHSSAAFPYNAYEDDRVSVGYGGGGFEQQQQQHTPREHSQHGSGYYRNYNSGDSSGGGSKRGNQQQNQNQQQQQQSSSQTPLSSGTGLGVTSAASAGGSFYSNIQLNHYVSSVQQHIEANSKYYTNSPTRMFEKSQAWLAQKEQKLISTYHEVYAGEDAECTFKPSTHTDTYASSFQHHHFAPPSMIDVGEANYIERQRAARLLKEEAARKMMPDTSRWENRRTVPKEFQLNKRDTAIPALRRPANAHLHGHGSGGANEVIVNRNSQYGGAGLAIGAASSSSAHPHQQRVASRGTSNPHSAVASKHASRATTPNGGGGAPLGFGTSAPRAVTPTQNKRKSPSNAAATIGRGRENYDQREEEAEENDDEQMDYYPREANIQDHQHETEVRMSGGETDDDDDDSDDSSRKKKKKQNRHATRNNNNNDDNNNNHKRDLQLSQMAEVQERQQEANRQLAAEVEALKALVRQQNAQIDQLTQGLSLAQRELVVARATIRDLSLNPQ